MPPAPADDADENPEEYVPDAHYEPVVPLPDKVEVRTGEEGEEVLFKYRAKLYVFNSETKEVKERGVGDLKILFNPETKAHRVVMRREQVHKLCANFRISNGMSISDKTGSKNTCILNCKVSFPFKLQIYAIIFWFFRIILKIETMEPITSFLFVSRMTIFMNNSKSSSWILQAGTSQLQPNQVRNLLLKRFL